MDVDAIVLKFLAGGGVAIAGRVGTVGQHKVGASAQEAQAGDQLVIGELVKGGVQVRARDR